VLGKIVEGLTRDPDGRKGSAEAQHGLSSWGQRFVNRCGPQRQAGFAAGAHDCQPGVSTTKI
jgi:hypothetical protein